MILDIIHGHYNSFFDSEKKIANYIIQHPKEVVNMTIKQLAEACQTSQASVSRFARKCQMDSFHHLKVNLARDCVNEIEQKSNTISTNDISGSLETILSNKISELTSTIRNIDIEQLRKIISLIENANHVLVCAVGNTIPVALDCMFKFNEIGISTFTSTIWENQASYALGLDSNDVVIAISNSGESKQVYAICQKMKKRGVCTIGITNNNDSVVAKECTYHIQSSTREKLFLNEFCFSRISAATIIEILYLFLTNNQKDSYEKISQCEELYASLKV
jgi:RpiR family carbohydrate utilization transcriptional regulator